MRNMGGATLGTAALLAFGYLMGTASTSLPDFLEVNRVGASTAVPQARFERMDRGLNFAHWWAQRKPEEYTTEWLDERYTAPEFRDLREMGFRHIRLPVDFYSIQLNPATGEASPSRLELLRKQVVEINKAGLFVVLDLHLQEEPKKSLAANPRELVKFENFWREIAGELNTISPDKIAFEVLNEPVGDANTWWSQQDKLLRIIREIAPQHTIIVSAVRWSNPDELIKQEPYNDPNVVYNIHYYEPFVFTHQGTGYTWEFLPRVTGLEYPVVSDNVRRIKAGVNSSWGQQELEKYLNGPMGYDGHLLTFKKVRNWARRHQAKVVCNEFGVCKRYVGAPSRHRWIEDTRMALEDSGIHWTMWEYRSWFGITDVDSPKNKVDPDALRALGMPPSRFLSED